MNKNTKRIYELEEKAKNRYIENIDWELVVECLPLGEQLEYWKYILEIQPQHEVAQKKVEQLQKVMGWLKKEGAV